MKVWLGCVVEGHASAHEDYVSWLCTDEAATQFAKYGLTGYSLMQHGDLLKVIMRAEEPLAVIRFLRNKRMWPDFWEFTAPGRAEVEETEPPEVGGDLRVRWRASAPIGHGAGPAPERSEAG